MKTSIPLRQGLFVPVCLCGIIVALTLYSTAYAEPRSPFPALPSAAGQLYHNRFDEAYWLGKERSQTVQMEFGTLIESWSGYALQRAGKSVTPFVVPVVSERGWLNVACDSGSVGFWFKPYWSSSAVMPGNAPGVTARLLDFVVIGAKDAVVGWSLQVTPDGNLLALVDGQGAVMLRTDIGWSAGEWHWVVLNYGTKGTALYVDESWVAEGDVTMELPPRHSGLVLGSSVLGDETAGGEFDDFNCYRKPMTTQQAGMGIKSIGERAALGAISEEEMAAINKRRAERKALAEAKALEEESSGGGAMLRMMGNTVTCVMNTPLYITNTGCLYVTNQGWTVTFDVQGTNSPADIFVTTNLLGNHITNSFWVFLERGPSCATYQYTNQFATQSFYILGTMLDTDGDGLTDAYEKLVSKTSPLVWTSLDTDGDGMPDAWEMAHGTNPFFADANNDPDLDGIANWLEYLGGTRPLVSEGFAVWVAQPDSGGNLP